VVSRREIRGGAVTRYHSDALYAVLAEAAREQIEARS
jgi:hypothetical protein